MDKVNKDLWFRAKTFGWGWGLPLRWEGWVVYLIYFFLVLFPLFIPDFRKSLDESSTNTILYVLFSILLTLILIFICFIILNWELEFYI